MSEPPRAYLSRDDLPEWASDEGALHPGVFPYLRGIHERMYTSRLWRMRQYAGFGTTADTNERWKLLLAQGQHGISCAFDLPTQLGFDSDHPSAIADAGRLGVAIDTLDDLLEAFDGIPLDEVSATFNINASAVVIYAMLLETAVAHGLDPAVLTGTIANDPLIEFIARGLWNVPPDGALRLAGDLYEYALAATPRFYPINLRSTLVYEAGGTEVQEIGFGFSCAVAYLERLAQRDVDMEAAASRMSFLMFGDTNVLEEACKFRAARMVWAELLKERFGILTPHAQHLRFTVAVGNYNLRAQVPELNLVRNTLGALAGVLGGCQGMLVAGMDEAFEIPSERNALLGLYTQQVIAFESHVVNTVDPLGGSYYVEATTERLRREIAAVIESIDAAGGAVAAIESGLFQREIADAAYAVQVAEDSGEKLIVGVNTPGSESPEDPDFELHIHDDSFGDTKRVTLAAHRARRAAADVESALGVVAEALVEGVNVVDPIRAAVRHGATLGEVMAIISAHFGDYREPVEV